MDIVITGSIAFDYIMRFPGKFGDYILPEQLDNLDLSFHVHEMRRHWGGTGANIAYTLALLGERPRLVGAAGRDFEEYRRWLDTAGVDTSTVRQFDEVYTAAFFATTDEAHHQIATFYGGAMDRSPDVTLSDAVNGKAGIVCISANHYDAMMGYVRECKQHGLAYVFDPAWNIMRMSGEELRDSANGAKWVAVNAYELDVLLKQSGLSRDELLERAETVVVTRGEAGADIWQANREIHIPAAPPKRVSDPTGAGDSFRGGLLKGLARGWPLELAGRLGALAATFTIEDPGPQSHTFTRAEFVNRFREAYPDFDDEGRLDSMLEADTSA